jgi:hypothetical protein
MQFGGWTIDDFCLYTADDAYTEVPDAGADGGPPDAGGDAGPVPVSAMAMGGCGCDAAGSPRAQRSLLSALFGSI